MSKHLIVAYQTAGGGPLRTAVEELAGEDPDSEFVLLVPATHTQHLFVWTAGEDRAIAEKRAEKAAGALREARVRVAEVRIGDPDPFVAVANELEMHAGYDSIIVSTFPPGVSRWLRLDLLSRLQKEFELPIRHVVVAPEEA